MSQTIAPVLGEATVQELREAVRGTVLTPSDDGYEDTYPVWNGSHDGQRPALIIRCRGNADVVAAIGFARAHDLTIAVRGGGHSVAGFSTIDCGVVIDLGPMNDVHVDPAARRATVGGGAVWVCSQQDDKVTRIDPGSNSIETIPVGAGPTAITYGFGAVWVANGGDGTVSRIDPTTGDVRVIEVGNRPSGIAAGSGSVWVTVQAPPPA